MSTCWWKDATFYQIWPRSFKDGNGDGIGDLIGVLEKLEYIRSLGFDALWFSPPYVSPQKDYGYDIADYRAIAPEYGTMADFEAVLEKAHSLGMRVIMDLVVNHTSDKHEWFLKSVKREEPYTDYYIWRKGKGKDGKGKPNNWMSTFPGEAWEWNEERGEYYLHLFAVEQPDLNMDNPKVREEVKAIMKFWLDKGVDGFREDVITFISKKEGLPNGFPLPAACGMEHYKNGPHIHEYLQEFRTVWSKKEYDAMTVGEAPMMTPKGALKYVSGDNRDLDMMFHFQHMEADCVFISWMRRPFNLRKLKRVLTNWQTKLRGKGWNALYLENHDQPRTISRYGNDTSEVFRVKSGKMLATLLFMQSGTPFVYQGQEIGMTSIGGETLDDYVDCNTFAFYKLMRKMGFSHENVMKKAAYAARDNARTPVQWSSRENAGFSDVKPWFRVNPNYESVNVETALADKNSILYWYKDLIKFRNENRIVKDGDFILHEKRSKEHFVFERNLDGKKLLVALSFVDHSTPWAPPKGITLSDDKLVFHNYTNVRDQELKPYECKVYLFDNNQK